MAVVLEVKAGPMSGEKIVVRAGQTVTFGRAAGRANFALPHDTFMSGVHFAIECGAMGPFLRDPGSSNGTFLNGARIKESPLTSGDEIRGGQTTFSVRLVADDKLPQAAAPAPAQAATQPSPPAPPPAMPERSASDAFSASFVAPPSQPRASIPPAPVAAPQIPAPPIAQPAAPAIPQTPPARAERTPNAPRASAPAAQGKPPALSVGSWGFAVVPQNWTVKPEFGMEHAEKDGFPSSVTATEELIGGNPVLGPFVESQLSMLRQYLREPKIEAAIPPAIPGAEEKASVDIRYSTNDGQTIFLKRLYARTGTTVGTITLMTLDSEFASIRPAYEAIVGGASFQIKDQK